MIKVKTLFDFAIEKKVATIGDLFKLIENKRIKVVANRSGHNYLPKFTMQKLYPGHEKIGIARNNSCNFFIDKESVQRSGIYLDDLALDSTTVLELEAEYNTLLENTNTLKRKVDLCKELQLEEFDEELITVIEAIDAIKSSKNKNKVEEAQEFLKKLKNE